MKKKYLVLENGEIFEGVSFGSDCEAVGEAVFTTGVCGYTETLTDPSYYGQIVVQTFPLIGNYGICSDDFEGKSLLRGYVVRDYCEHPSNFRSECTVGEYLEKNGIPAISGIDTRCLTRILRENGVMNAGIFDAVPTDLSVLKGNFTKDAVHNATTDRLTETENSNSLHKVVLMDFGAKRSISRELERRGCEVITVPSDTTAEKILSLKPDGVMLSNGPGDPAENVGCIAELTKLLGKVPVFGICLGHQLMAIALGAKTVKLHYGHRGANQPVKHIGSQRTYITSQNHGYAVDTQSVTQGKISFVNANDGTCEGIDYPELNAFSVQFHPEAHSGPRDTMFLFEHFIDMM